MKIGDRILCRLGIRCWFTAGHYYIIDRCDGDDGDVLIIDDMNDRVAFSLINRDEGLFHNHFYTEKEMRKMKLERLERVVSSREVE